MKSKIKLTLLLLVVLFLGAKGVFAYIGDTQTFEDSTLGTDQYNTESSTLKTATDLMSSLNLVIIGPAKEEYRDRYSQKMGGGAIASVSNLITSLYSNPPASAVTYFADVLHNIGVAKPAYAQGIGFSGLIPILPIWKAFRNISYVFFIIIFISLGFAIMLRAKIDPKTTITIQNALPRVVVALILVTFSYAIAGFLIDLIYLILGILIAALGSAGLIKDVGVIQNNYMNGGFMTAIGAIFNGGLSSIDDLVKFVFPVGSLIGPVIGGIIGGITGLGIPGAAIGTSLGTLFGGAIASILVSLIILVMILYVIFKLFLLLLKAYISIILGIIFSPFQILLGTLPGQSGFGGWLKTMMSNILVFPTVAGMFLIGGILTQSDTSLLWSPPMLAFGNATRGAITSIIGLGILFMIPKAAEKVQEAFQIKPGKPADWGPISWLGKSVEGAAQKQFGEYVTDPTKALTSMRNRATRTGEAIQARADTSQPIEV